MVSVMVMTDADWAGDAKDRGSNSGIAVWVKGSVEKHVVSRGSDFLGKCVVRASTGDLYQCQEP